MMKFTLRELIDAADTASKIVTLQEQLDAAKDQLIDVRVSDDGGPGSHISITMPEHLIRTALIARLEPLHTKLRNMGIELEL